ncbi:DNA alkylation repair protein [Streptococcus himalayensis]|uniref:DNA alkylation repair protein n=1 Tax=Streptococcus himalayensis TaxID=1888195 RepID=A0A917A5B7_9STRE|nr:DNA alkylation repair protein [Streptococcus himalayensis]GGE28648.1 DNA alkylation repair protein [Streptococcus himalayensis]
MRVEELQDQLKAVASVEDAEKMTAYLRNQFPFLGVRAGLRRKISKEFFKPYQKKPIDWNFVEQAWANPYREIHYAAIDYLATNKRKLTPEDLPRLKTLITTHSWWDSVDGLDKIAGEIAFSYPKAKSVLLDWSVSDNIWLRRVAIDHQLLRKQDTDTELLEQIVVNNLGQTEFFINKAIGWSLRDYSKVNPAWVRDFIAKYEEKMAPLSIREASKYI